MHAATYSGHAACCAVGLANLAIFEREGLVERAREVGAWFQELLSRELGSLPGVGEVRGIGLMAAVELVDRGKSGSAFYEGAVPLATRVMHTTTAHEDLSASLTAA